MNRPDPCETCNGRGQGCPDCGVNSCVILLEPSKMNIGSAEKFGSIRYLCTNFVPWSDDPISYIARCLGRANYDPDKDYVCITGRSLGVSMLMFTIGSLYGRANLLIWDGRNGVYTKKALAEGIKT